MGLRHLVQFAPSNVANIMNSVLAVTCSELLTIVGNYVKFLVYSLS